ncbi:hypothetical protein Peur_070628 [Populus x canadensis]
MVYKPDGYVLYKLWPAKSLNIPFFCAAEANMLYLESPAGVGFSYSAKQSFYALVNDTITDIYILRLSSLQHNTVSYSCRNGHYVPQLTYLISQSGLKFNLKAIAVSTE